MHYIIQENTFREKNYDKLIDCMERFNLSHEIVHVGADEEEIKFTTNRTDVFCFGALKLARLSKKYNWIPGALITENLDYNLYKNFYKQHLLNSDSTVYTFGTNFNWSRDNLFIRPCLDSKAFTGKVWDKTEWLTFKEKALTIGHSIVLTNDTLIQVAEPKEIYKEYRFWIINGEIITSSQYKLGNICIYDSFVDECATEFCKSMLDIHLIEKAFTMDICATPNGYKIVECGSVSCAGFYECDMQKLIMSLEDNFNV